MPQDGLLAIFAHPDDETFFVGGTMARYADAGRPVTMICATRGEVGEIARGTGATPETLGTYREQELRDACTILGVTDVRFLNFRDSGMQGTADNENPESLFRAAPDAVVEPLVRAIRELRPAVVATWDASGGYGHPDHIAVHHHATGAVRAAADAARFPTSGTPWQVAALFYTAIPMSEFQRLGEEMAKRGIPMGEVPGGDENIARLEHIAPNCVLDVGRQYERKIEALAAHKTQISEDGPFGKMPEDLQRSFMSREYFHRIMPPLPDGVMLDDLFTGLTA